MILHNILPMTTPPSPTPTPILGPPVLRRPELYYVEDSDGFADGKYQASRRYGLKMARSLSAQDMKGKKLDLTAASLVLSRTQWDKVNDGVLSYEIYLAKPIQIPGEGPISRQEIPKLQFLSTFREAPRGAPISSIVEKPIFRGIDVDKYLTSDDGILRFQFEVKLGKSKGSNSDYLVDIASSILRDPILATGLSTIPYFPVASVIFGIIRDKFFGTTEERPVWPSVVAEFRAGPGPGYPIRAGRFAFISSELFPNEVEERYRYLGGRVIDIARSDHEPEGADQFYLDIFAR